LIAIEMHARNGEKQTALKGEPPLPHT
jgi:hypothetical protein